MCLESVWGPTALTAFRHSCSSNASSATHERENFPYRRWCRLATIEQHVRSHDYDDKLAVVEALAAPYALAFVYEIRRLDALLVGTRPRLRRATNQQG